MNLYNIIGCKRGGHHSIAFWLMCQEKGETHYLGDEFYPHKQEGGLEHQTSPNSIFITTGDFNGDLFNKFIKDNINKKQIVINTENHPQCTLSSNNHIFPKNNYFTKDNILHIITIRDIYNNIASALVLMPDLVVQIIKDWKSHAKEILGYTKFLKKKYCIIYNNCFDDILYRKKICSELELYFTDKGIDLVPHNGCGSSFSKCEYNKKANKMLIHDRYKLVGLQNIKKLITEEDEDLNKEIFGWRL